MARLRQVIFVVVGIAVLDGCIDNGTEEVDPEEILKEAVSYLDDFGSVEWVRVQGNTVVIGFEDNEDNVIKIVNEAAMRGRNSADGECVVYGVDAAIPDWKPGHRVAAWHQSSQEGKPQPEQVTREDLLRERLSYLEEIEGVEWVKYDDNTVVIGFEYEPDDMELIVNAAALHGNRAIDFGVHVWGVNAKYKNWRPDGSRPAYIEATARYGKVQ